MFDCLKRTLQLFFDIMLSAHISKLSTVVATTLFYFLQTSRKDAIPPGTLKKVIEQAYGEKKIILFSLTSKSRSSSAHYSEAYQCKRLQVKKQRTTWKLKRGIRFKGSTYVRICAVSLLSGMCMTSTLSKQERIHYTLLDQAIIGVKTK